MSTFGHDLNSSPPTDAASVPEPAEPVGLLPGFFLRSSISSGTHWPAVEVTTAWDSCQMSKRM